MGKYESVKKRPAIKEDKAKYQGVTTGRKKVKIGDKEDLKEFTKDELQAVIDYLEMHKLPVNDKTTNLVCRKYASGKLDIFANNFKKKK